MSHVFTYGSLMYEAVWSRVVDGRYRSRPAVLRDHRRHAIAGEDYPGLVAAPGASVEGLVYLDVDPADVERLDRFEGDDYDRLTLDVQDVEGIVLRADAYLYRLHERLLDTPWDADAFALDRFLATYCRDRLDR